MLSISHLCRCFALFVLFALVSGSALGSEYRETSSFADPIQRVEEYAQQFGAADTLLVIDIDNTLLAMSESLGSDQWFEWQSYLLKHEPHSPYLVADDFSGLLAAQGLLFAVGKMHAPEEAQPALITKVQELGVPIMVLTSRGHDFRDATERELKANGYDFIKSALKIHKPQDGAFAPYDLENLAESGLTDRDKELYGLKPPRPVSYEKGVFMAAGQHKGAMLLTMIHKAKHKPRAVVFIDDHGRHINRVYDAMLRRSIEVSVYHYKHEDANVNRFRYADKSDVAQQWRRLEATIGLEEPVLKEDEAPVGEPEPALQGASN